MIDVDNATPFLLDRGLIDVAAIVDGDLTIRSVARRNRNLRVEGPAGSSYLLKQADDPIRGGRETLRIEAAFCRFCASEPAAEPVRSFLPRLAWEDVEATILAFELVADSSTLGAYHAAPTAGDGPIEVGRALGRALGTFHRVFGPEGLAADPRLDWLPRGEPWILSLHKPAPELLAVLSPANYRTLQILQAQPDLCDQIDRLRRTWRADAVIHADIKADNVLVRPPGEVWLVDWEMVQMGDPAWDLAGAFHDFLLLWISSMPPATDLPAEEMMARATHPIGSLRGAIRALWGGYQEAAGLAPAVSDDLLRRAVAFSAARLIQSAYEMLDGEDRLTTRAVLALQVGANLLADPRLGQVHLYGIPLGFPGP